MLLSALCLLLVLLPMVLLPMVLLPMVLLPMALLPLLPVQGHPMMRSMITSDNHGISIQAPDVAVFVETPPPFSSIAPSSHILPRSSSRKRHSGRPDEVEEDHLSSSSPFLLPLPSPGLRRPSPSASQRLRINETESPSMGSTGHQDESIAQQQEYDHIQTWSPHYPGSPHPYSMDIAIEDWNASEEHPVSFPAPSPADHGHPDDLTDHRHLQEYMDFLSFFHQGPVTQHEQQQRVLSGDSNHLTFDEDGNLEDMLRGGGATGENQMHLHPSSADDLGGDDDQNSHPSPTSVHHVPRGVDPLESLRTPEKSAKFAAERESVNPVPFPMTSQPPTSHIREQSTYIPGVMIPNGEMTAQPSSVPQGQQTAGASVPTFDFNNLVKRHFLEVLSKHLVNEFDISLAYLAFDPTKTWLDIAHFLDWPEYRLYPRYLQLVQSGLLPPEFIRAACMEWQNAEDTFLRQFFLGWMQTVEPPMLPSDQYSDAWQFLTRIMIRGKAEIQLRIMQLVMFQDSITPTPLDIPDLIQLCAGSQTFSEHRMASLTTMLCHFLGLSEAHDVGDDMAQSELEGDPLASS